VRFSLASDDFRPVINADGVERLALDGFKFTQVPGVKMSFATTNVGKLIQIP